LFLTAGGVLSLYPSESASDSSTYTYDPSDPVPTIGGNNLLIPCGPLNQTSLYGRQDIISFVTTELTDNILVCGQMEVVKKCVLCCVNQKGSFCVKQCD
jgi:predicted acyl esterase